MQARMPERKTVGNNYSMNIGTHPYDAELGIIGSLVPSPKPQVVSAGCASCRCTLGV